MLGLRVHLDGPQNGTERAAIHRVGGEGANRLSAGRPAVTHGNARDARAAVVVLFISVDFRRAFRRMSLQFGIAGRRLLCAPVRHTSCSPQVVTHAPRQTVNTSQADPRRRPTTARSGPMRGDVTLPIQCPTCEGLITLHFDAWKHHAHPVPPQDWNCPHCRGRHSGAFSGTLTKVTRRHTTSP